MSLCESVSIVEPLRFSCCGAFACRLVFYHLSGRRIQIEQTINACAPKEVWREGRAQTRTRARLQAESSSITVFSSMADFKMGGGNVVTDETGSIGRAALCRLRVNALRHGKGSKHLKENKKLVLLCLLFAPHPSYIRNLDGFFRPYVV